MSDEPLERALTVKQLIEILQGCDPDRPVMLECEDGHYSGMLTADKIDPTGFEAHSYGPYQATYRYEGRLEKQDYPAGAVVYEEGAPRRDGRPWIGSKLCVVIHCWAWNYEGDPAAD